MQPPALKALIAVCASDDRYADDAHYMGGCLLNENFTWGALLFTLHVQPPDPLLVGNQWRTQWLGRLQRCVLFPELWLRHQRPDDEGSLCFDFPPLEENLEILGAPQVTCDRPLGQVAVRLNDLAPDGASTRVSYGLLNLTHREGHRRPVSLVPGRRYRIAVILNDIAYSFPRGHRLRLALSTGYWPVAWPAPLPTSLNVSPGASFLDLPHRPPRREDGGLAPFPLPAAAPGPAQTDLRPGLSRRTVERDVETGETVYTIATDVAVDATPALWRYDRIDLIRGHSIVERFLVREGDPLSARTEIVQHIESRRGSWRAAIATRFEVTCDREFFYLYATLRAREAQEEIFSRIWRRRVPRNQL